MQELPLKLSVVMGYHIGPINLHAILVKLSYYHHARLVPFSWMMASLIFYTHYMLVRNEEWREVPCVFCVLRRSAMGIWRF